jgi:thiol-disulfide isomerase/thioredoxin
MKPIPIPLTPILLALAFAAWGAMTDAASKASPIQDKKDRSAVSLKPGDPAPALKASRWLQGQEVKKFEEGKVYVVEFWATWCGPCIAFMPDLGRLHAQYKDKGLIVIGFTARDIAGGEGNGEDRVAAFVKKRGPKLGYSFAYADDLTTCDAWLTAAGRTGIPCTFVVDKEGKIAYIGHPLYLDVILPKVLAGNVKAQAISDEVAKVEGEFTAVSESLARDRKAGLGALKEFEDKYPPLANSIPIIRAKLSCLPKFGKAGEAKEYVETLLAKAIKEENTTVLRMVSSILRLGDGKESKELLALAVQAAEADVRLGGDQDARALLNLAGTYAVAGQPAKAREYASKALEAAAGEPALLQAIEQEAKKLQEQLKDKK